MAFTAPLSSAFSKIFLALKGTPAKAPTMSENTVSRNIFAKKIKKIPLRWKHICRGNYTNNEFN